MPPKKKLPLQEKTPPWRHTDAGTTTDYSSHAHVGTQTDFTRGTSKHCVSGMPPGLTQDRGVQWPEYEFNYHGEEWKVQMDHMYCSKSKCPQEVPSNRAANDQHDSHRRATNSLHDSHQPDRDFPPQSPATEESEASSDPEIPEGYFFSKRFLKNKRTLSILQIRLFALLRHMVDAPHTDRNQRSRTRKLLSQIVEVVCLMVGEDLKLINMKEDLSRIYQKQGEVPVRFQDVAVFFTKEEWNYVKKNDELYKAAVTGDPAESTEDLCDHIADEPDEESDLPNDYFFKLLNVDSQGAAPPALPRGRKRKRIQPNVVTNLPETIFKEENHEDSDWNNYGGGQVEYFSDFVKEETVSEEPDYDVVLESMKTEDTDVKEENVSDREDFDSILHSMKTEEDCSTDDSIGWSESHDSHEAPTSSLWIAEDGTTSTQWRRQPDSSSSECAVRRPRGRRKIRKAPDLLQKAVAATDAGDPLEDAPCPATDAWAALDCAPCPATDACAAPDYAPRTDQAGNLQDASPLIPAPESYIWKKRTKTKAELERQQMANRKGPQKCNECPSAFNSRADLDRHKAKKHNALRYPCQVCGLQYNYHSQYVIHFRSHTGEKPFSCKVCGQAFGYKRSLILHMKKHSGDSGYKCGRCGKLMDSAQALQKHRKLRFCISCRKCLSRRALCSHRKMHGE